jgi:hypothetical protein
MDLLSRGASWNHRGIVPMVDEVASLSVGLNSTPSLTIPMIHIYVESVRI